MAYFSACNPLFRPCLKTPAKNGDTTEYYEGDSYSIGKMIKADIGTPQYKEGTLYADDTLAESKKIFNYAEITLNTSTIPILTASKMFGASYNKIAANGNETLSFAEKNESNYGAFGFVFGEVVDGTERYGYEYYPRVKFDIPANSFQTAGENIEFGTPTISGRAYAHIDSGKKWRQVGYFKSLQDAINGLNANIGGTLKTSSVPGSSDIPGDYIDTEENEQQEGEEE